MVMKLHQQLLLLLAQKAPGSGNNQSPQQEPCPQTSSRWQAQTPGPPPQCGAPILDNPLGRGPPQGGDPLEVREAPLVHDGKPESCEMILKWSVQSPTKCVCYSVLQ